MPSSHLACDGSMEPVSCPYPPLHAASTRPPCRGRRRLRDFPTDSQAPRPLRFCLAGIYTNFKNRKSVACRQVGGGIAQSPHGNSTESARFCTISVRIYPGLPPRVCTSNHTMLEDNVNTYAVAHAALLWQKEASDIPSKFELLMYK